MPCRDHKKVGKCRPFCVPCRALLGAPPLKYPAAPGLSPSDRPPPFALLRSFVAAFLRSYMKTTCRENPAKPLQVGRFSPYPSRKTRKTSTGRAFFALPVEKMPQKFYGSGIFWLTCQGKRPNPLQVASHLTPQASSLKPQAGGRKPRRASRPPKTQRRTLEPDAGAE